MRRRRVVITGVGVISPLGASWDETWERTLKGESGIRIYPDFQSAGLSTGIAGAIDDRGLYRLPRHHRRTMGRVAELAVAASQQAISMAAWDTQHLSSPLTGIAFGSSMGSTASMHEMFGSKPEGSFTDGMQSTTFLKIMPHTCAANIATYFSIPGRVIATPTACAASTQAIGYASEAIRHGACDRVICGGSEELHPAVAAVFDVLRSTSQKNGTPSKTPRPFDNDRDGLVVSEGAAAFALEERESAVRRGQPILGEILGFYSNNDARHLTNPSPEGLEACMRGALLDADLRPEAIGYLNAHGTGTVLGDAVEARAIELVFGKNVPVSSCKGHLGHMMGACGAVESALTLKMLNQGRLLPTLNLDHIDPVLPALDYIQHAPRSGYYGFAMKNSFAFGGINATLIIAPEGR